jgi:hypothetical protein
MEQTQAAEIAALLNTRNRLTIQYTAQRVLDHADDYLFELDGGVIVGCVEVKKVQ